MGVGTAKGLPGEFLLLFTLVIWLFFSLIYLSNPKNRLNRWCFVSGIIFSMGIFKEYLYFTFNPFLIENFPFFMSADLSLKIYSVLTAVLYYFAMPSMLIFSFYFFHLDSRHPRIYQSLRWLIYLPCVFYSIVFPYINTRDYQLHHAGYYISVAIYNWLYGIIGTILIIKPLIAERLQIQYRQRKMVAIIVLLPIWYWLISSFPVHIFGLKPFFKIWQGNLVVILGLFIYYIYNVFQDGIWGTRLQRELYDWTGNMKVIQKNAQYLCHTLKNEISKIEWCVGVLREQNPTQSQKELDIINRSSEHLKLFINKTKIYSNEIILFPEPCDIHALFEECIKNFQHGREKHIDIKIMQCDFPALDCDRVHIKEVLQNLINNAADAIEISGQIELYYCSHPKKKEAVIQVKDNGYGIKKEHLNMIFDPYHTTKATNQHLGLGLFYCYNVMDKHHGCIKVKSIPQKGTEFILCFPSFKKKQKKD